MLHELKYEVWEISKYKGRLGSQNTFLLPFPHIQNVCLNEHRHTQRAQVSSEEKLSLLRIWALQTSSHYKWMTSAFFTHSIQRHESLFCSCWSQNNNNDLWRKCTKKYLTCKIAIFKRHSATKPRGWSWATHCISTLFPCGIMYVNWTSWKDVGWKYNAINNRAQTNGQNG